MYFLVITSPIAALVGNDVFHKRLSIILVVIGYHSFLFSSILIISFFVIDLFGESFLLPQATPSKSLNRPIFSASAMYADARYPIGTSAYEVL